MSYWCPENLIKNFSYVRNDDGLEFQFHVPGLKSL
mgnify:CR=1 FL=1